MKQVKMRISIPLYEALRLDAFKRRVSMNQLCNMVLTNHIRKQESYNKPVKDKDE